MTRPATCVGHKPHHRRYLLNCQQLDYLVRMSEGRCAICSEPHRKLFIDHDHDLGWHTVRGLVCPSCNAFLVFQKMENYGARSPVGRYLRRPFHASGVARRLARQHVVSSRKPGAKMPKRPPAPE